MQPRKTDWKDFILPIGIVACVVVVLVPLPAGVIDILLTANIALAVIVLLTTLQVRTPLEFSMFPALLLGTALSRLVLNIATTRLILSNGAAGENAAGGVINNFGQFVAGDHLLIGLIIFSIIVVIQFVVVTKGTGRVSEVAARFTLDAMPGKQMAIDADLAAGLIDQAEATRRRDELNHQADFYGSMDGASKFVRGDAIAGIVITLINIVGGIAIGMSQGMGIGKAIETFSTLTIGDGLASQLPAFMIAIAAGFLITRSKRPTNLSSEFLGQLFGSPQVLFIASGFLLLLIFTNLPTVPMLTIGASCAGIALVLSQKPKTEEEQTEPSEPPKPEADAENRIEDLLAVDPLEIEIGVNLIALADPKRGGDLLQRINSVRQVIAKQMGIILPKVRIRDNLQLSENQYRIKINNNPVATGQVWPSRLWASTTANLSNPLEGIQDTLPTGQEGLWIEFDQYDEAIKRGYLVKEASAVLAAEMQQVAHRYADVILSRDATQHLVNEIKKTSPAVVEDLIPDQLKLSEVQQVLRLLLREGISIRQLGTILESLGDHASKTHDPVLLCEFVRQRLAKTISLTYADNQGVIHAAVFSTEAERQLLDRTHGISDDPHTAMSPLETDRCCEKIAKSMDAAMELGHPTVLLVNPQIRPSIKLLTSANLPDLVVLSQSELTPDIRVNVLKTITDCGLSHDAANTESVKRPKSATQRPRNSQSSGA